MKDLTVFKRVRSAVALIAVASLAYGVMTVHGNQKDLAPEPSIKQRLTSLYDGPARARRETIAWITTQQRRDMAAALIAVMRFAGSDRGALAAALETLTGESHGDDWFEWMLWQQAHPEIEPVAGFDAFKAAILSRIDTNFRDFLYADVDHEIRLEEIVWGGVTKDGIPALTNPALVAAGEADYLGDNEPVFGIVINGDERAYPYRIMDWHEMFNDVIGGVPVALAYCTLCGSGILFETAVEGRAAPFTFGSSGLLYRSNKLMYDQQTHSLWNQFTGRPVVGELTGSGVELKVRPVVTATWGEWKARHPGTRVLSLDTGYRRDYDPGRPYDEYFASSELMFPALTEDRRLAPKDQVFGLRVAGANKAWPLALFEGGRVLNDSVGVLDIVLIGDAGSRSVRAYRAGGYEFETRAGDNTRLVANGREWRMEEASLVAGNGERLSRLPGHLAYWFAWSSYFAGAEFGG
ncbi:MAG: DUF3179 domain-containing protein [Proteobacteria bacterium]|nr:DUF3179 domain-containing protein [Pseudomonadota bacterium]